MEDNIIMTDLVQKTIQNISKSINDQLKEEIVKRLRKYGYILETELEIVSFFVNRCKILVEGVDCYFYADEMLICQWKDRIDFRYDLAKASGTITRIFYGV